HILKSSQVNRRTLERIVHSPTGQWRGGTNGKKHCGLAAPVRLVHLSASAMVDPKVLRRRLSAPCTEGVAYCTARPPTRRENSDRSGEISRKRRRFVGCVAVDSKAYLRSAASNVPAKRLSRRCTSFWRCNANCFSDAANDCNRCRWSLYESARSCRG